VNTVHEVLENLKLGVNITIRKLATNKLACLVGEHLKPRKIFASESIMQGNIALV